MQTPMLAEPEAAASEEAAAVEEAATEEACLLYTSRTELMEGIFGLRAHTSGRVWIKGEEVNIRQPRDAIRKSVALLTEDRRATGIMGVLSVSDNISIASLDALRKGPIMLDDKKIPVSYTHLDVYKRQL